MKRKYNIPLVLVFCSILLAASCKSGSGPMLPGISGSSGEIMMVIEKQRWEGPIGEALRELCQEELKYLPQPEDMFSFIQISPDQFGPVFQSHRNLLIVRLSSELAAPRISVRNDVWASPQIVLEMSAPDQLSLATYIKESRKEIQNRITLAERQRLMNTYTRYRDKKISEVLRDNHQLSLAIPMGYKIDYDTTGFISISNDTPESTQGILIYYYTYSDTNTFTPEFLILKRNQITRRYIEGPSSGSWMAVERILEPEFSEFTRQDRYFACLKGLWMLEKGSGGGPFLNLSTVDEKRNRVVSVDGYVYAPGTKKRELRRQVEAIIHSLVIPE